MNGDGREPVGVHDLRHSFVAVALAPGMTLPEAALARHANPRITATIYAGLTVESPRSLNAIDPGSTSADPPGTPSLT